MGHPEIKAVLDSWDIENPYHDLVNRDDILLIDNDIDRTLAFLHMAYYPKARAELVEPLSRETGFSIYHIKG